MNILVIGSGGREHAIAWKLNQSPKCDKLFVAPGNGGTAAIATNLSIGVEDFESILSTIIENNIELVVVGPEVPLVEGLVDRIKSSTAHEHVKVVGPGQEGARLEGSKDFAKQFMNKYNVPTAKAEVISKSNLEEGKKFLESLDPPYVLKADGLAAGKGVIITRDLEEAKGSLGQLINGQFGAASETVLIEEFLSGIEISVFALTDGKDYVLLPEAKDYKRIGEGDQGPNTGGMGAVSPVIFADRIFMEKVEERIVKPTVEGISKEGYDYHGFIFFGLIRVGNEPYVIEYNVRMGDPETEVVIPRIKSDLVDLLLATAEGNLSDCTLEKEVFTACTVMLVAEGYPGSYEKGKEIQFSGEMKSVIPFHAGTKQSEGKLVTTGGRVIAVTGLGENMGEALSNSYEKMRNIDWEGKTFRTDIGFDLKQLGQ
ncbi:MAG: phosphoribosylamine--glycine ligase [Cyclobacteriaceae bacterium]